MTVLPILLLLLLLAALLELTLGARLLLLARKTHGAAETSLGVAFLVDAFAQIAGALTGRLSGGLWVLGYATSTSLTVVATGALLLGVVRVFEQHRPMLLQVAIAVIVAVVVGHAVVFLATGGGLEGQFVRSRWLNRTFSGLTFTWAAIASMRAHNAARRQLRIGLSSRLEATRFLLWAIAATAFLLLILMLFVRDTIGLPRVVTVIGQPVLAVACVTAVWWTFFPPAWLERRLEVVHGTR